MWGEAWSCHDSKGPPGISISVWKCCDAFLFHWNSPSKGFFEEYFFLVYLQLRNGMSPPVNDAPAAPVIEAEAWEKAILCLFESFRRNHAVQIS